MHLEKLSLKNSAKQWDFIKNLPSLNGFENPCFGVEYSKYVNEIIPHRLELEKGINLPNGYVPDTWYFLVDKESIVGIFKIRHYLNEYLKNGAGHIGYSIKEEFQGKGYGTKGLALAIKKLKNMPDFKEDEIYLSCSINNPASLKVMLKNNGYIHHESNGEYFIRIKL